MGYEFGVSRRVYGVVYGVVTDNVHPEGHYKVKVAFPWIRSTDVGDSEDFISPWARIVANMGGAGRGFYCLPEIDDEVLISFVHGDMRHPVVIGALWNDVDKMPMGSDSHVSRTDPLGNDMKVDAVAVDNKAADGKNDVRVFVSRAGHQLVFDDSADPSVSIFTSAGHTIHLDDSNDCISIVDSSAEQYLVLNTAESKILMESKNGDIDIFCKNGTFNLEAKEITTTSTTTATHEATNEMTHKSKKVVIEGSSLVDVDGGKIELN